MDKVSKNLRLVKKPEESFESKLERLRGFYDKYPDEVIKEMEQLIKNLFIKRNRERLSVRPGIFPEAQAGISCALQVAKNVDFTFIEKKLISGLDTLKFSLWLDVPHEVFSLLETTKKAIQATQNKESLPVFLFDSEWNLSRTGNKKFSFVLNRGDVSLLLSKQPSDGDFPNGRLEIGSMSCWEPGYELAFQTVIILLQHKDALQRSCKIRRICVSEVHLCVDAVGLDIDSFNLSTDFWRRRAKKFSLHYDGGKLTGATIGSGALSLRVYDKILELKKNSTHKQPLFKDVWGVENFDDLPVTRTEFHLKREALRGFSSATGDTVETFDDLCESLGSLWRYLTGDWAVMTATELDRKNKHQSFSPVHPIWQRLASIDFGGSRHLSRQRFFHNMDMDRLEKSGLGYFLSVASGNGCETVEEVKNFLAGRVPDLIAKIQSEQPGKILEKLQGKKNKVLPYLSRSVGGVLS